MDVPLFPGFTLSAWGLIFAGVASLATVFTEVARKKSVTDRPLLPVLFWSHLAGTALFAGAWFYCRAHGGILFVHPEGDTVSWMGVRISPLQAYAAYQFLNQLVHALATWLFFKALQESAMSTSIPFLAFTPVLMIPTGFLLLGELPGGVQLLGVLLTATGSLAMHWRLFATGWTAPFRAIAQEKGSRRMLYVALLLAALTPLDKKLALMTDPYTQCVIYGAAMSVFFLALAAWRRLPLLPTVLDRRAWHWLVVAGLVDAVAVLAQFEAYQYTEAVVVISIKRAGIVLAVWFGGLFFRERGLGDKLVAATVMFGGVTLISLPLSCSEALLVASGAILLVVTYIYVRLARPISRPDPQPPPRSWRLRADADHFRP